MDDLDPNVNTPPERPFEYRRSLHAPQVPSPSVPELGLSRELSAEKLSVRVEALEKDP